MSESVTASPSCRSAVVVVATYGRAELLERMLRSLESCDDPGIPVEVIVVENGAPAQSRERCTALQYRYPLHYHFLPEACKSAALNLGIRKSQADLVIFFDDDNRLDRSALRAYVDAANRYGRHHFFGGAVEIEYEAAPPDWLRSHLPASARGFDLGGDELYPSPPEFLGISWAAFREELVAAGGFPLDFGPSPGVRAMGEETQMQRRLQALGSRGVYLPSPRVWHHVPASRCTPEWTIDRHYRLWFTCAFTKRGGADAWRVWDVPLWVVRQHSWDAIRAIGLRLWRVPLEKRLAAELRLAKARGTVEGYRQRARRRRIDPAWPPPAEVL